MEDATLFEVINNRFDEQEKLIVSMFNAHNIRLNNVETILGNRDSDHEKIETRVIDKLEPKINYIIKSLDEHIKNENDMYSELRKRIENLENVELTKSRIFKDKIKTALISWGIPVMILILIEWIRNGMKLTPTK